MARCFITGVELDMERAYLLDKRMVWKTIVDLKSRLTSLEKLANHLGKTDNFEKKGRNQEVLEVKKHHRLVSKTVAEALTDPKIDSRVFIPWILYRARSYIIQLTALQGHPDYRDCLKELSEQELEDTAVTAIRLFDRINFERKLSGRARKILLVKTCPKFMKDALEEIVHQLKIAVRESDLSNLGIPEIDEQYMLDQLSRLPGFLPF